MSWQDAVAQMRMVPEHETRIVPVGDYHGLFVGPKMVALIYPTEDYPMEDIREAMRLGVANVVQMTMGSGKEKES